MVETPLTIANTEEYSTKQLRYGSKRDLFNQGMIPTSDCLSDLSPDQINAKLCTIPLLNHKSESYNNETHVGVRLLSSKPLPIDLSLLLQTKVEQDTESDYLKTSTYTKHVEKAKYYLNSWISSAWAAKNKT